jgi:ABC-type sugar transport system ATPase subunit
VASVSFDQVTKRFDAVEAVRELTLAASDGEFLVLVGPSGSGKTTALRMLAGLESVSDGEIRIGERVVNRVAPRERDIAMVFQDYALYPQMTVYDNLAFALRRRKTPKDRIDAQVRRAAAALELDELLARKPGQLSGGQQQRVALGRALVRDPVVFLMDEPLSNLDAKLRVQTRGEIKRLQKEIGTTTVYVTHDQVEAMTMGDRIAVMNHGRLEQVGTPEQLYATPQSLFIADFVGRTNRMPGEARECADGVVRVTLRNGCEISAKAAGVVRAGDAVVCTIRPEKLRIGPADGNRDNVLPVTMRRRSFLGSSVDLAVDDAIGAEMLVRLAVSAAIPAPGERVVVAFSPDDCLCFRAPAA